MAAQRSPTLSLQSSYQPAGLYISALGRPMHFTSFAFMTVWPLCLVPLVIGAPPALSTGAAAAAKGHSRCNKGARHGRSCSLVDLFQ